jgi:glycosyltransferase involved in cell wall biosynthesis
MKTSILQAFTRLFKSTPGRRKRGSISSSLRAVKYKAREEVRLTATRISADVLALQTSIEEIRASERQDGKRLAVLSILPPSESGVARFTVETFGAAGFKVDIFSEFERPAHYLNFGGDGNQGPLSVWHLDALPVAHRKLNYDGVVVVLANSTHNVPIAQALRDILPLLGIPVYVQIHDPRLQNLARRMFADRFEQAFLENYPGETRQSNSACLRMIFGGVPIDGIIVHSDAAKAIVADDIGEKPPPIHKLFHPVFESTIETPAPKNSAITFGVPGRDKCTTEVLEAFRIVRRKHPAARLIMAGYNADEFAQRHPEALPDGIEVYSSPSDRKLLQLMAEVDVAVQLRRGNNGESSGVVPQLICLGKPVIVSPVGAFVELGNAAIFTPADPTPIDIARCIEGALRNSETLSVAIGQYANAHTASVFCERLSTIVWPPG